MRCPAGSPASPPSPHDSGFTLVEVSVALLLAAILLISLTVMVGNAVSSVRHSRSEVQATALALERIEFARSLPWAELAVEPAVSASDPRLLDPTDRKLIGILVNVPQNEDLVENPSGLVEYWRSETLDEQDFEVFTYVTAVEPSLRRVVAVVEWTVGPTDRMHMTSSLISEVSAP